MKSVIVGSLEVRGDLKANKKQLKKMFGKYISDDEIDELYKKLNPNDNIDGVQPKAKKVRKRKKFK